MKKIKSSIHSMMQDILILLLNKTLYCEIEILKLLDNIENITTRIKFDFIVSRSKDN